MTNFKELKIQMLIIVILVIPVFVVVSCGPATENGEREEQVQEPEELDPMENPGIGPIDHVELDEELDEEMIAKGRDIFQSKCEACHHIEGRYVGPPVGGITERRTPEWIMNMILNPSEMLRQDPIAKALFAEYMMEMTFQNVSEDEARAILEYFRKIDREGDYDVDDVM
jgi:cytochrome c